MEEKEDRQKLIQKYKNAMSSRCADILIKDLGADYWEGTVFTSMYNPNDHREEPQETQSGIIKHILCSMKDILLGAH